MTTQLLSPADDVTVYPATIGGLVDVPGDKSLSHRALLFGALADGTTKVTGLADSGDVRATADALRRMGVDVALAFTDGAGAGTIAGTIAEPHDIIDCGNSGTSLRLLSGIAAGIEGLTIMTGDASLRRRPVDRVRVPLEQMGAQVWARQHRLPPVAIRGGRLRALTYHSPVASAQVKSCLLFAGFAADGRTTVISPARSRDHTERLFGYLGHPVDAGEDSHGREVVTITPGQLRPDPIDVCRDPSSAAFWLVAAIIGGDAVTARTICINTTRTGFVRVLEDMGATFEITNAHERAGEPAADVTAHPSALTGGGLSGSAVVDAIDELPILALAGALSANGLTVRDAAELRVKESDRIATLARLFAALDMRLTEFDDGFSVEGGQRPQAGTVDAAGDHRIAMTAAIAATVATGPVRITGFAAVASSYPTFEQDLRRLGGRIDVAAGSYAGDREQQR
ncbi:MAG: 3-phosphoshikimate 1-carboxyvinyltransferase [Nitriliruptoraceae bacterium]